MKISNKLFDIIITNKRFAILNLYSTINMHSGIGVSIGKDQSISFSPSGNFDTKAAGASFIF